MKKLNTKLKLLSMALVGLGGLALASGAAAQSCPSAPVAWTGTTTFGGSIAIASPGLDGTNCLMEVSVSSSAGAGASVVVHDGSPNNEPRYRAQFIIDTSKLGSTTPGFSDAVTVLTATSSGAPVTLGIYGDGSGWNLSYSAGPNVSGSVPLVSGENRIEFDLQIGATGSFSVWVNNSSESAPDAGPITVDNSAMAGITDAYMGLVSPTGFFVSHYAGEAVQFDQFDSRRQTFIGF